MSGAGNVSTPPKMPKNATILIVRHGEKPDAGIGLAPAGRARAQAYVTFFAGYPVERLFAAANSKQSCRPQLTLLPLASALDLPIDDAIADGDYGDLATQIAGDPTCAGATSLICWHHQHALLLAGAFGVDRSALPPSATWPKQWPGDVYGWLLLLVSDDQGNVDTTATRCINQKLMHDDHGQDPPAGSAS